MTFIAKHISVSINLSAAQVYEFASNPKNLAQWASGLGGMISKVNDHWIAESPMGTLKINFAERNIFGVLDHYVTLPSGAEFYNPMRVFANDRGSEIVFTLYRQSNMTDQTFAEDAAMIERDLTALKTLLEQ